MALAAWALASPTGSGDAVVGQGSAPEIATDDQDISLVVWVDSDGDGEGIKARLVDKQAVPLGDAIIVNSETAGSQRAPDVVSLPNGDYLVVWQTDDQGDFDVAARRFDRAGLAIGLDFRISAVAATTEKDPVIAQDGMGHYAVVWTSEINGGHERVGQVFDEATDVAIGSGVLFGKTTHDAPTEIGTNDQGEFLATWEDDTENIKGQRFDNAGLAIGLELQISEGVGSGRAVSAVAEVDNGEYYVVWEEDDADGKGIFGRKVDAAGLAIGLPFQINRAEAGNQRNPSIGRKGANLVVVWQADDGGGAPSRIVRRFVTASNGRPIGNDKTISEAYPEDQHSPAVSPVATGPVVAVWQDGYDLSSEGVSFIRLQDDQNAVFGDSFEEGDFSGWSAVVP